MMERARSMVGREPDLDGHVDRLRAGDLKVPYKCPYCGTTVEVTGTVNPEELDACRGCGSAVDSEAPNMD
jgi:hypothetical protein